MPTPLERLTPEHSASKPVYIETLALIERLHRRFLDVVRAELDHLHIADINNIQTLILYNIGDEEVSVGELTQRGYYLGSNVSYNLKNMVENGYLTQTKSPHDKRSSNVKLSDKGKALYAQVDAVYHTQSEKLTGANLDVISLKQLNASLRALEGFWSAEIHKSRR
jgi:DNA-binding MarR family transcriptional regulator